MVCPDTLAAVPGHVFISYARTDQHYVDRLVRFLASEGLSPWVDHDLDAGDHWTDVIREQVDACAAFIPIMSPGAEHSPWVNREIMHAEGLGKPILPILLAGRVFFRLADIQYEDAAGGRMPGPDFIDDLRRLSGVGRSTGTASTKPDASFPEQPSAHEPGDEVTIAADSRDRSSVYATPGDVHVRREPALRPSSVSLVWSERRHGPSPAGENASALARPSGTRVISRRTNMPLALIAWPTLVLFGTTLIYALSTGFSADPAQRYSVGGTVFAYVMLFLITIAASWAVYVSHRPGRLELRPEALVWRSWRGATSYAWSNLAGVSVHDGNLVITPSPGSTLAEQLRVDGAVQRGDDGVLICRITQLRHSPMQTLQAIRGYFPGATS